jgi:alanyl-tRNA synthetase
VRTTVRDTAQAIASGAVALFGEKYGEKVRVVAIGDGAFSTELCGGTHVRATGDIGAFVITEESGVAAGVRRVEAVTGLGATTFLRERLDALAEAARALNAQPKELVESIAAHLHAEARLRKDLQQLRTKLALGGGADEERVQIDGATLVMRQVPHADKGSLRSLADSLKSKLSSGVVFLAGATADGRVAIVVSVTPDLASRAPAGQLVKLLAPIVGGGGGGRADFAEAGGKEPEKIPQMLAESRTLVARLLAAGASDDR